MQHRHFKLIAATIASLDVDDMTRAEVNKGADQMQTVNLKPDARIAYFELQRQRAQAAKQSGYVGAPVPLNPHS